MTRIDPDHDTIVAIATPPGLGGVAIVRLSGERSLAIGRALFQPAGAVKARATSGAPAVSEEAWPSHLLRYGRLIDPKDGETLDSIMAVYMAAPRTYTGEPVVELHLHGSPLVCDLAVRLATEAGARLATPGEFTQRAFLNGKLDLAQAESVLDLIESRSREQARLAAQHLEGRFSQRVRELREATLQWLALLEAEIDFGDEIDNLEATQHRRRLSDLQAQVAGLLSDAEDGRLSVTGLRTVLAGAPNAGKSSLLNALLKEDRALVTPVAGTTRDRIEVDCLIAGVHLCLTDTAGLRLHSDDPIERMGMEKTREALRGADLQVLVIDSHSPEMADTGGEGLDPSLILLNKADLVETVDRVALQARYPGSRIASCELLTEAGRDAAVEQVVTAARDRLTTRSGECFSLNSRHRESLTRAGESFAALEATLDAKMGEAEFLALDLRRAATHLGEILGLDITEEVLDRIFGQFCLGK